jgi:hypothetical protein
VIVRQERPDDARQLVALVDAAFGESPDPRRPDAAWMALPLAAWDPAVGAPVVYPDFFPPPPGA